MKRIITVQRSISPPRVNPVHAHDHWEIVYYTKGGGEVLLDDGVRPFSARDLFCFPPGVVHGERSSRGYASTWIRFHDDSLAAGPVRQIRDPAHSPCAKIVGLIYHEYILGEGMSDCIALLDALLGYVVRRARDPRIDMRVKEMKDMLINSIPDPDFTVKRALGSFGAPYITMHLLFKKYTGVSPLQYLLDLRVREASLLLGVKGLSLREIARQTGFRDPYYFSRIFKKKTGISPRIFRQRRRIRGTF